MNSGAVCRTEYRPMLAAQYYIATPVNTPHRIIPPPNLRIRPRTAEFTHPANAHPRKHTTKRRFDFLQLKAPFSVFAYFDPELQLIMHEGKWAMISKGTAPEVHFVIHHPKLRSAIESFIPPLVES